MSIQISLAHFFKQPNGALLLLNLFSRILNDLNLDVFEKESKLSLKKVTLARKIV